MLGDRRGLTRWPCSVLAVVALVCAGCGGGDDDGVDAVAAAGYMAVIDDFLPPVPADGTRPLVYVARLGDEPFALEDQVEMIAHVGEAYDLRFVDDVAAAVDDEDVEAPPRDDGLLLGIGTITSTVPHTVRVEVYTAAGSVDAQKLTLSVRDDVWQVDAREPIDAEVLVGDE